MVHCAALVCTKSTSKKNEESIIFFKLPKDAKLKKMGISKLKRDNLPKEENIHVCHFHFDDSCFKRDLRVRKISYFWYILLKLCKNVKILK